MTRAEATTPSRESPFAGLSELEATNRLRTEGYNELPSTRAHGILATALNVVREPMLLLLLVAATLYLFLGELREAVILLGSVLIIMGITFFQERRTERTLEALRDLSSPRALVVRDGQRKRIAGREVVRGDMLILAEGDRVPADAIIRQATNLSVDESLLTGESVPVRKEAWNQTELPGEMRPGGDGQPFVYSGTLVVQGQGIAEALRTGPRTEIGKIGGALTSVEIESTPLQIEIGRLVRVLALSALAVCGIIIVWYGIQRGDWLHGLLAGLTLAMALIPEEFPVILTVFLALGAWRIAQREVLTRRTPAIQALGSVTVLCVDKTGTLTQNRMIVRSLATTKTRQDIDDAPHNLSARLREIVRFGALASQQTPFDPMERALHDLAAQTLDSQDRSHARWRTVRAYPLTPELLAVTYVWQPDDAASGLVVAAKGAPEAIMDLCHMDASAQAAVVARTSEMADDGLRVLGIAQAQATDDALPDDPRQFAFTFVGLVGLADPIRPAVPDAIRACYSAGIRVVMITGDYPGTAQAIARQIGLKPADISITGPELDAMSDDELAERVQRVSIFARVVPQQKLRLVTAFKRNGEIVAMTGDGVNDAPALKAAHIGVAMGGRGTDVAREAAGVVLLDDNFTSIVQAVRLGRRIFDNLRKAMAYIFAIHVPIAGLALLPVLFGWPLILMPVHIVFLELIIDPSCSIVFEMEPEEQGIMERPPRDPNEPVFSSRTIVMSMLQGASILAAVLVVYLLARAAGENDDTVRALAFTTLITANLGLILADRSWTRTILATLREPNPALWWVIGGAALLLALTLSIPPVRDIFRFAPLSAADVAIAVGVGLVSILWFEGIKLLRRYVHPAAR